jgi:crotonobetainyl-CoA:carnitine CoA-transferase CaiB-like acyl-CoA transferase
MMAITGEPDRQPMRVGFSVADTGTGLQAAFAIASALVERSRTNRGQFIDVAMLDSAISLMSQSVGTWLNAGVVQERRANISISREPAADTFDTADGTLMLGVMSDPHFVKLVQAIGLAELATDPRCASRDARVQNAAALRALIQARLAQGKSAEWQRLLDAAGVPCSPVLELADALTQPQVEHRQLVVSMHDEATGKSMRALSTPFTTEGGKPQPAFAPQRLGAQTAAVLTELGYSEAQIADLAQRKII